MTAVMIREATEPPEARGITRDAVRMMVAHRANLHLVHAHAHDLPQFLNDGDLVVVNTSGTLAAALDGHSEDGTPLVVHLSQQMPGERWLVELRRPNGRATEPWFEDAPGPTVRLAAGASLRLLTRFEASTRLWVATLELPDPLLTFLAVHGRPIRYSYVTRDWPLDIYQNVYAREPGSAEMPSAGRPFTPELVTRLVAKGVAVAPLVLHTGVSSLEANEHPYPEWYRVPASTAARINETRARGGQVIAIGTTVVRALESVVDNQRVVRAGEGWTDVVVTPERGAHAIDGLLSGWHEPEASHLQMLEAIAGRALLDASYAAASSEGYLWHEFGDVHLIVE